MKNCSNKNTFIVLKTNQKLKKKFSIKRRSSYGKTILNILLIRGSPNLLKTGDSCGWFLFSNHEISN